MISRPDWLIKTEADRLLIECPIYGQGLYLYLEEQGFIREKLHQIAMWIMELRKEM